MAWGQGILYGISLLGLVEGNVPETNLGSWRLETLANGSLASRLHHRLQSERWNSQVEIWGDTLRRVQLGWSHLGHRISFGNIEEKAMPLLPKWLPRREIPLGYRGLDSFMPGFSNAPIHLAIGMRKDSWQAYALRAENVLMSKTATPWDEPWKLQHFSGGAQNFSPWSTRMNFSETRIVRGEVDTVTEQLLAVGLTSPAKILRVDWAVNSTSNSSPNNILGQALGLECQFKSNQGALGEMRLRLRSRSWYSVWDSSISIHAEEDSFATTVGSAELRLRLRIPFRAIHPNSFIEGESWNDWGSRHRAGVRGRLLIPLRWALFEVKGRHAETNTASGMVQRASLAFRGEAGGDIRWEYQWQHFWKSTARLEQCVAAAWKWNKVKLRPGLKWLEIGNDSAAFNSFLETKIPLGSGWHVSTFSALPLHHVQIQNVEWSISLRYSERHKASNQRVSP